jgi:PRTRC genetic system protein A
LGANRREKSLPSLLNFKAETKKSMQNLFSLREGNFVEHKIASVEAESITAIKFEYLLAGNGLFIRAKRREFSVCLALWRGVVKNLPIAASGIVWHKPQIPAAVWQEILDTARRASFPDDFKEDVFIVFWSESDGEWKWFKVSRERSWARTIADDTLKEYGDACIELHTHPLGAVHFSRADDADETGKFRLFGILTDVHTTMPKIRFRCGVYEYFVQIPAVTFRKCQPKSLT